MTRSRRCAYEELGRPLSWMILDALSSYVDAPACICLARPSLDPLDLLLIHQIPAITPGIVYHHCTCLLEEAPLDAPPSISASARAGWTALHPLTTLTCTDPSFSVHWAGTSRRGPAGRCREEVLQRQVVVPVRHFGLLGDKELAQAGLDVEMGI